MKNVFPETRTAILTGAGSPNGIGAACARHLASLGWNIGLIDIDADAARATASDIAAAHGVLALGAGANVAVDSEVRAAFDELEAGLPDVVALVNVAGVTSPLPYLEMTREEWDRVIGINLNGVHYATRRAVETMVRKGIGRVISIGSVSAQRGGGRFSRTPYSASKAGIVGFTRSIARELGGHGITANVIAPGPIQTDIMGVLTPEMIAKMAADGVLTRIGTTRDVAAAVAFLASENAGFVTGHTLNVNGGLYMN